MFKKVFQNIASKSLSVDSSWLIIFSSLYFTFVLNIGFWRFFYNNVHIQNFAAVIFSISFPIVLFIVLYLLFSLIVWPYIAKPIIILLLLISSATNYLIYQYNVYIDSDMIRNVFQTNQREAFDLITVSGVLWVFFLGIIPSVLLAITKIKYKNPLREVRFRLISNVLCMVLVFGVAAISYKEYASFGRNNSKVTRLINTTNYIYATSRYIKNQYSVNPSFVRLDPDASYLGPPAPHPTVFILIVGEAARAKNFSLNGYSKNTNPLLSKQDIINFKNVTSCGTATAISVPCMFSHLSRENNDSDAAKYKENMLDILQTAGYDVWWRENDDGCKGVCNRVKTEEMVKLNNPKYCDGRACLDDVLLEGLEEYIKNIKKDTFIVLHTMGSHGPTYYRRYPAKFNVFKPTCDTAEIQNCSQEAITNTYDNTILYTDYIVSSAIDILRKFPHLEAGLLYVSDHGESLGENNIYLHGLPYSIAPSEQKEIPMILWMSENMKKYDHINYKSLKEAAQNQPYSHDHLFHSLMALMEVKTSLYDPSYDMFKDHRTKEFALVFSKP